VAVITLINVYSCVPERQAELVALLQAMTEEVTRHLPGFASASVHRGLDGRHVANYAQWESEAAWRAMVRHPKVQGRMAQIVAIATFQPHLYELASTHAPAS
jgi:heme-degrading monooxygenase HmoA